jgi:hypothetical protein
VHELRAVHTKTVRATFVAQGLIFRVQLTVDLYPEYLLATTSGGEVLLIAREELLDLEDHAH